MKLSRFVTNTCHIKENYCCFISVICVLCFFFSREKIYLFENKLLLFKQWIFAIFRRNLLFSKKSRKFTLIEKTTTNFYHAWILSNVFYLKKIIAFSLQQKNNENKWKIKKITMTFIVLMSKNDEIYFFNTNRSIN